jgi:cellulose synthase (UDP-forming)
MAKPLFALVWFIAAACIVFIVSLPINLQTHLIAGTIVLLIMILLKLFKSEGTWRLVALAFGTAIVLRYVYWRTTSTLPPVNQLESFIPGLLLYLAEMYSVFMLFLSLFIVARPLPSRPSQPVDEDDLPSVDVFIPSYNEDPVLLADTIAAAMALDYPADRLTVWLLDDGGTDQKRNSDNVIEGQIAPATSTPRPATSTTGSTTQRGISSRCSMPTTHPQGRSCARRLVISTKTSGCSSSRRRTSSSIPIRSSAI